MNHAIILQTVYPGRRNSIYESPGTKHARLFESWQITYYSWNNIEREREW